MRTHDGAAMFCSAGKLKVSSSEFELARLAWADLPNVRLSHDHISVEHWMGSKSTMTPSTLHAHRLEVVERDPLGPARLDPVEEWFEVDVTTKHISPDIIMPGLRPRFVVLMLAELGNLQIHNNSLTDCRQLSLLSLLFRTADVEHL